MNASHLAERPSVALKRLKEDFYFKKTLTWDEYRERCKKVHKDWERAKERILEPICMRKVGPYTYERIKP